jgi:hypothetical protein
VLASVLAMPILLAWSLALLALASLPADAATVDAARQASLRPEKLSPLTVIGAGFGKRERVRVTITPTSGAAVSKRLRAKRGGTFTARFPGVETCGGFEARAVGRRGSRASFQFSAVTCGF